MQFVRNMNKMGEKNFKNVIIPDSEKLKRLKKKFSKDGISKFSVISDFERTLTYLFVDGKRVTSLISILRDENYLGNEYSKKAKALFNKYHPIEIDPKIPIEEKKSKMEEWWRKHYELLIKAGLKKHHIEKIINSGKIKLRKGCPEFLDFLYWHRIPLLIFSSSGLGGEVISAVFKKEGKLYPNIYIISNFLKWDKKGNFVGVKEPLIHSLNKNGSLIRKLQVFKVVKNRKNVLLLGDNIEDCQMINGLKCENVIKIGFLNEEIEKNLNAYQSNFEALILNDNDMDFVNEILRKMFLPP